VWVNGDIGVDTPTCGPAESPCKTLNYTIGELFSVENLTYVEISLQSNIIQEVCDYGDALSPMIIHINGYQNTIKASTIAIPKVEYVHTWFDSSTLEGYTMAFMYCTITQSEIHEFKAQEIQPELTLTASHVIDSFVVFPSLNISETVFSNSPITTPFDGRCDITNSNFTGTTSASALLCGRITISNCVFNGNYGKFGGAINVFQFAYILDTLIFNNSAILGGGIYSQGIISLDNTEIVENQASQAGGGLYFYGSQADIECLDSVTIANNYAEVGGGMMILDGEFSSNVEGSGQMCLLQGNTASNGGGAIYINSSSASLVDFVITENSAPSGAGIFSIASALNLSSVTINGNIGGGIYSQDSPVIFVLSRFVNNSDTAGASLDVKLQNSSSYITSWDQVYVSAERAFACDDCVGKLCSAGSSCSDCSHGCITMGTKAICVESQFGCVHGECETIKDKSPTCLCDERYTGDLCDEHMRLSSKWENAMFIIIFGVGCTLTLVVVVAFIVRLHRHRAQYQPLLR
jgi:predicted outer membrane repeat protein